MPPGATSASPSVTPWAKTAATTSTVSPASIPDTPRKNVTASTTNVSAPTAPASPSKTFFHAAKDAGISVSVPSRPSLPSHTSFRQNGAPRQNSPSFSPNKENDGDGASEGEEEPPLPTFAREIRDLLPEFFRKIVDQSVSKEDADILLLSSLTVISATLPNVSGIYNRRPVWTNLFLFVTARASSGKGRLSLCKFIIDPIHYRLREINEAEEMEYEQKMQQYQANKKKMNMDKLQEPPLRMLFIPTNSSATAVYQVLGDNDGQGIMFETEGDTLANTFSSDYGNYSDGFRKAFHHETSPMSAAWASSPSASR